MAETIRLPSQSVYERIRDDIICCAIAPAAEISEPQLSKRHGATAAAVRAALNRLVHDGHVHAISTRAYIAAPITLKDIHDTFELRLVLEPAAARLAAGKVSARTLRELDAHCRSYERSDPASAKRFVDANIAFHTAIARATGNARLADAITNVLIESARLLYLALSVHAHRRSDDHTALARALALGDAETAKRRSREHIEAARERVLSAALTRPSVMRVSAASEGA